MLEAIIGTIVAAAFIGAIASWFIAVVNVFRTVANRREGVPLFPIWFESPFNILFRPAQLTDRGLIARRRCFYGVIGFVLSILIVCIAAYLQENLLNPTR
jgi:hypothetical protein